MKDTVVDILIESVKTLEDTNIYTENWMGFSNIETIIWGTCSKLPPVERKIYWPKCVSLINYISMFSKNIFTLKCAFMNIRQNNRMKKQRLEERNGKMSTGITFTSSTRSWTVGTKGELYENRQVPYVPHLRKASVGKRCQIMYKISNTLFSISFIVASIFECWYPFPNGNTVCMWDYV